MTSIVVPAYNCMRSLECCVRAVCRQTVSDWELILVDDGSTDGSGTLCDQLAEKDERIRVIHKSNGGVSSARNAGIKAAEGEYLTFCDSDDYLEPDYLEMLLCAAADNPDCGHVWCCFQTVSGYQREDAVPNYLAQDKILHFTLKDYMTLHGLWLDTAPWNKLFRADVIRDNAVCFPEDISLGEDWLFCMDYIDASGNGSIAVVTKPLYNYMRGNGDSLDSKYRADLPAIYRRLISACGSHLQKWDVPAEQTDKYHNMCFYMYENILRNTMRSPDLSEWEKIRRNSAFLKGAEFREILKKKTCRVHPLYLAAYRSGDYNKVLHAQKLTELSRKLKGSRR